MSTESLLDFVRTRLSEQTGSWPLVARESGVPYSTVKKIALGETPNPGVITVEKLARYFRDREAA